jgi:MFS family permease
MGPLRTSRHFRALFASRTLSNVGDALGLVALMLFLADHTGQATAVALLLLVADFAPALLAPLTGALADRFDLRRLMVGCEVVQGLLVAGIALWLPPLPVLLALVGLRALAAQAFLPASRAALPLLIGPAELERGNATLGLGSNVGDVAGPLLAASLIPLLGLRGTLALDALTFAISAAALMLLPALPRTRLVTESVISAARTGIAWVWSRPFVRVLVLGFAAVVACNGMDDVALVFFARRDLAVSTSVTAILLGGVGIGLLLGFAALARVSPRVGTLVVFLAGLALSSAGNLLTGLAHVVSTAIAFQVVRGLGTAAMDVGSVTLLQRAVPDDLRGRVFGNLHGLIGVGAALSYVVGGLLVDRIGARATLLLAGSSGLLCALVVGWRLAIHARTDRTTTAPLD